MSHKVFAEGKEFKNRLDAILYFANLEDELTKEKIVEISEKIGCTKYYITQMLKNHNFEIVEKVKENKKKTISENRQDEDLDRELTKEDLLIDIILGKNPEYEQIINESKEIPDEILKDMELSNII